MTTALRSEKRKGVFLVLTAGICWGIHGVLIKLAYAQGASFMEVFLVEAIIASVIFVAILWRQGIQVKPRLLSEWAWLILAGFASVGVGSFLFLSFSLGPVAIGATLLFLYLPQVYLFSAITRVEKWDGIKLLSIGILLAGAAIATDITSAFSGANSRGAIIAGLLASTCYASIFILTPKISKSSSTTFRSLFLSLSNLIGSVFILSLLPTTRGDLANNLVALTGLALLLGIIGQALPILSMMKGIPLAGPSLSGVLASTELPVAVVSSALILNEPLTMQTGTGVMLVFCGIVLFNSRSRR